MSETGWLPAILTAEGTLQMQLPIDLPAGPVEVLLRPLPEKGDSWWEYLQRERTNLRASGFVFRSKEEIDKDREDQRALDADRDRKVREKQDRLRFVSDLGHWPVAL